jgi:hypothetical protein
LNGKEAEYVVTAFDDFWMEVFDQKKFQNPLLLQPVAKLKPIL